MSILKKFKSLFENKELPEEKATNENLSTINLKFRPTKPGTYKIETEIIASSDSSYLASKAARICVGMGPILEYKDRLKHLSKIMKLGHESISEHSNIVIAIHIPSSSLNDDFFAFMQALTYIRYKWGKDDVGRHVLLMSGSIRAYKHILRYTKDVTHNIYCREVINALYVSAESVFFEDLIEDGIMEESSFSGYLDTIKTVPIQHIDQGENAIVGKQSHYTIDTNKGMISLLSTEHHKFKKIYNAVKKYGFDKNDLLDIVTVSVEFKHISRPISMQIIRHRNAVTQESQRYVEYSNKGFIDPMKYSSKEKKTYKLSLFGKNFELNSEELGNRLCKIYKQLLEQGMKKEEARGFLPANVNTKVLMTFTYRHLFHFFLMRDDKAAQPEIQAIAKALKEAFREYEPELVDIPYSIADMPIYKSENVKLKILDESIDEVIEEELLDENDSTNNGSN